MPTAPSSKLSTFPVLLSPEGLLFCAQQRIWSAEPRDGSRTGSEAGRIRPRPPPPLSGFKEGARELVQRLLHQKIPVVGDCELSTVYL